jgi:redox-sensing transcriptional repressor
MNKSSKIPYPTIERLALYSRPLKALLDRDTSVISSEKLAELCGGNPAQIRKDLAYFGEFGVRGVGYDVKELLVKIREILSTDRTWTLCIVGMGNLGRALVENENFRKMGYLFMAAFDADPKKVGQVLPCGLTIEPASAIGKRVRELHIQIGVVTTPPSKAQRVANQLIRAGIKALLNFTPIQVRPAGKCIVENVDFSVKLENLAYHLAKIL